MQVDPRAGRWGQPRGALGGGKGMAGRQRKLQAAVAPPGEPVGERQARVLAGRVAGNDEQALIVGEDTRSARTPCPASTGP